MRVDSADDFEGVTERLIPSSISVDEFARLGRLALLSLDVGEAVHPQPSQHSSIGLSLWLCDALTERRPKSVERPVIQYSSFVPEGCEEARQLVKPRIF